MKDRFRVIKKITKFINLFLINHFFSGTRFWNIKRNLLNMAGFEIGANTKIVGPIKITGHLIVGDNCWIGTDFFVYGNGCVHIGNNCDIAPGVVFFTGGHDIGDAQRRAGKGINKDIYIGNGCWICGCTKFLAVVSVGCSTVVAAGSVVNKDVPDNVLAAGVPCSEKKKLD